jgi:hypothetical protein|tara:strand:- start:603 stop:854 length:252 start_codon:yes stop_codon:yes gene_type:complete
MSKIKEEELKQIQEQEQKKNAVLIELGKLVVSAFSYSNLFAGVQKEQEDLKVEMEKEYGKINIDIKDGSYTEIKEDEEKGESK